MSDAQALYEAGRYAEALPLALATADTLEGLILVGKLYHELARYDEAADVWDQIARNLDDPEQVAQARSNLALELKYAGRLQEALPINALAVERMRAVPGGDPRALATLVNNLGETQRALGHYADAERSSDEALALRRAVNGEQHPDYARTLAARALLRKSQGRYAEAETLLEQALTIYRATLGEGHPDVAGAFNTLAGVFATSGRLADAHHAYEQALARWQQSLGGEHPNVGSALSGLATIELQLGNADRSAPLFEAALRILVRRTPGPTLAAALGSYAQALFDNGDFSSASALFEQALPIWEGAGGASHPDLGKCLVGLGVCRAQLGPVTDAIPLTRRGLEILEAALGPDHPETITPRVDLAAQLGRSGAQDEARVLLERARAIAPTAEVIEAFGGLEQTLGHHDAAIAFFEQTLAITAPANRDRVLHNIALSQAGAGRPREALDAELRAAALQDASLVRVVATLSDRQRVVFLQQARNDLYALLSLVRESFAGDPVVVGEAFDALLRRKGIAAEALSAERDALLAHDDPGLRERLAELRAVRSDLATRSLAGDPRAGELGQRRDQLERELAREIPELAQAERLREVDRAGLAAALPEDAALVEIVLTRVFDFDALPPRWSGRRYLAFVLTREGVRLVDLGDEAIDQLVEDYLAPFSRRGAAARHLGVAEGAATGPDGSALRALVFDPLDVPRRVLISPDGALARLPFESLPGVLDDYEISYLSTGRDLLRAPAAASAGPAVVIADPDYDLGLDGQDVSPRFGPLPGTAREGEQVAARLGVQALTGPDVLETTVKALRSPSILHIATHGFFLADTPVRALALGAPGPENALLRSGLALAGANATLAGLPFDGILYAEDVTGLDLVGTELVVLSACDSGLGDVRAGEGVFGLRRAFALAGADTLVMSLWPVPDAITQELMDAFYSRLAAGASRAGALREAQLEIRARHPAVADWGAFILEGRTEPLARALGR